MVLYSEYWLHIDSEHSLDQSKRVNHGKIGMHLGSVFWGNESVRHEQRLAGFVIKFVPQKIQSGSGKS